MAPRRSRRAAQITGSREAMSVAATLGGVIRASRRARGLTLASLAERVGLGPSRMREIERGLGARASLETWIALGIALDRPLAVAFSRPVGAPAHGPADGGHLEIQEYLLRLARESGRPGSFELPTRPGDPSRSTDVGIRDPRHRVRILAECWNTFGDLGASARSTNRKVAEATATWPDDRIARVWIVRDTAANRALLARYPHIVDAAFPGSSRRWVRALTDADVAPPTAPGVVWYDPATRRLTERRRATMTA